MAQLVKNLPAMWETWVQFLGWENPLKKGKATHSSIWPGEFHGLYNPWSRKEWDMIERFLLPLYLLDLAGLYVFCWVSQVILVVKNLAANAGDIETWV